MARPAYSGANGAACAIRSAAIWSPPEGASATGHTPKIGLMNETHH
jgi:hypothetical protein